MKTFQVGLSRIYVVTMNAENKESARRLAELFLGHCFDESTPVDRGKFGFSISEIEMVYNEAFEAEEVVEEVNPL